MTHENLTATYTKEIEISLNPYNQHDIRHELHETFVDIIGDMKNIDPAEIPGKVLRDFFETIVSDMIEDDELWED